MNKDRRDRLSEVTSTIEEAKDQIQEIIDEEQDALDNLPDSLQDSERGLKMCDAINDMENLIGALDGFNTNLDGIVKKYSPQKKKKKE
jgi:hypothetical protein